MKIALVIFIGVVVLAGIDAACPGECKNVKDCPSATHRKQPGLCPGLSDIQCCIPLSSNENNNEKKDDAAKNIVADVVDGLTTETVGKGAVYMKASGGSGKVFVGMAGCFVGHFLAKNGSEKWVRAMYNAKDGPSLKEWGFTHLFAGVGPYKCGPTDTSVIDWDALARKIQSIPGSPKVLIVGHSSGSFTAAYLVTKFSAELKARTTYINLDGGFGPSGVSKTYQVFATNPDSGLKSTNAGSGAGKIAVRNTFCKTAVCLHMALIVKRPVTMQFNPASNIEKDYEACTGQTVETGWLSTIPK